MRKGMRDAEEGAGRVGEKGMLCNVWLLKEFN